MQRGSYLDIIPTYSTTQSIIFEDPSARLILEDATLTVSNSFGQYFLSGALVINGESVFENKETDTMKALYISAFGDDGWLALSPGSKLTVKGNGGVVYKNITAGNLDFSQGEAYFAFQDGGKFLFENDLDLNQNVAPFDFVSSILRSTKGSLSSSTTLVSVDHGATVSGICWSSNGVYLAAVGAASGLVTGTTGRIYTFDGATLNELAGARMQHGGVSTVRSVVFSPDFKWLATGGDVASSIGTNIYSFDGAAITTTPFGGQKNYGQTVYSVDWTRGGLLWNVAGLNAPGFYNCRVYNFNGCGLAQDMAASFTAFGADAYATSWNPDSIHFAVGGADTGGDSLADVKLYSYDPSLNILNELPAGRVNHGAPVYSLRFHPSGRYLAIGGGIGIDSYSVRVYSFDGNGLNEILGCRVNHGASIYTVVWSTDGQYLAIGGEAGSGGVYGNPQVRIYKFNGTSLTEITGCQIIHGAAVYSLAWSSCNCELALGGARTADNLTTRVYNLNYDYDSSAIVTKNGSTNLLADTNLTDQEFTLSDITILGNNYHLDMGASAIMHVDGGSTVTAQNLNINNVHGNNIRLDDSNSLLLLNCSNLNLDADFSLTEGAIWFDGDCDVEGAKKFTLNSTETSKILEYTNLMFGYGMTLSYDPRGPFKNLLQFKDRSSRLLLDRCTLHTTSTGMQITKGDVGIFGSGNFENEGTVISEGIIFGDGNPLNDPELDIFPGVGLKVDGVLVYNGE